MILQQLADTARKRVAEDQKNITTVQMRAMAEALAAEQKEPFRFYRSLSQPGMRFICEVKKASPSKGLIAAGHPWCVDISSGAETDGYKDPEKIRRLTEIVRIQG